MTMTLPDRTPKHIDYWSEDDGPVLWWKLPVDEPPYCGTPLDSDWPGYHTHWTTFERPIEKWAQKPKHGRGSAQGI